MPVAENNVYKFIYDSCIHVYMAKLYWKVKVDGKWTFRSATITGWTTDGYGGHIVEPVDGVMNLEEEE